MKATLESTTETVTMRDSDGQPFKARVWQGITANGVPFVAYIGMVQVQTTENCAEFERDLQEHAAPSESTRLAIDLRFVL